MSFTQAEDDDILITIRPEHDRDLEQVVEEALIDEHELQEGGHAAHPERHVQEAATTETASNGEDSGGDRGAPQNQE